MQFFCRQCCGATDGYNFAASLTRIGAVSPDVAAMRGKADSELNLLQFYDICLPRLVSLSSKEISIHKPLWTCCDNTNPGYLTSLSRLMLAGTEIVFFALLALLFGHERVHVQLSGRYRGGEGAMPPLEAHAQTLPLQRSVE